MRERIAVLGGGAWGTALACVTARNGHETLLWARDSMTVDSINTRHENPAYLPGISLPEGLRATDDLQLAAGAGIVLLVTPAQSVGEMAVNIANHLYAYVPVILCAKGINRQTGKLPAETVGECLPANPVAALSGPSFATDVASHLPTAVTLAARDIGLAQSLAAILSGPMFRVYASDDIRGVELGGALKNVIALAVGVCRGMGLGASAEAALVARGFAELTRLATAMGGRGETLMGLSGLGDLVLTCSSPQSRNFSYGMALGKAGTVSALPGNLPLAEGALTASIARNLSRKHAIDAPVIETVAELLDGTIAARDALTALLSRPLKRE